MIGYDSVSKKQRYFKGHDNNIKCLDLSTDGNYLITCQDSIKNDGHAVVKVWDYI